MKTAFALLAICVLALGCDKKAATPDEKGKSTSSGGDATSQSTPSENGSGPYAVKSGIIEYTMEMMGTQKITTYFDDHGSRQATYMDMTMEVGGQKVTTSNVQITDGGYMTTYDPQQKTGKKIKVPAGMPGGGAAPGGAPSLDFSKLTDEQKKQYHLEEIESREIAGKEAKGYSMEVSGIKMKMWVWENIPLHMEMDMGGTPMKMTATSVQTDVDVPADKFTVPSDVKLTES